MEAVKISSYCLSPLFSNRKSQVAGSYICAEVNEEKRMNDIKSINFLIMEQVYNIIFNFLQKPIIPKVAKGGAPPGRLAAIPLKGD